MAILHILWDDSHIWGLLAVRAARAMNLPYRLVRGGDIARGLFEDERPSLLFVPGGNARHKAENLGKAGIAAIRDYVASGGRYLGFCGGAGLALTWDGAPSGLGLCPWHRASFDDRLQHFMSGHLHMTLAGRETPPDPVSPVAPSVPEPGPLLPPAAMPASGNRPELIPGGMPESPLLPVWWPGRFAPEPDSGVTVLASYERPGNDFWLADLPIADLPDDIFAAWRDLYGLSLSPAFLAGQPCVIHGRYGRGGYVLSYSHLETPDSPHANRWLAHLLRGLGGLSPSRELLPPWQPRQQEMLWDDPDMDRLSLLLEDVLQTGVRHGQLFYRNDWLMGWRTGIPGANLNNLWSALSLVRSIPPGNAAKARWEACRQDLLAAAELFAKGSIQYLLAERLAMTLAKSLPAALPPGLLKDQRESLFGPPMHAGGLYKALIDPLDTLAYLQLS